MLHDRTPTRQPLLWAALAFSAGIYVGAHAWRPPSWWVAAVLAFILAALWFLRKRAWFAKGLALGTWFLLGALLIQVRGNGADDSGISALADGREVTLIAHVTREGYARNAGPQAVRQPVDVETESVEDEGESRAIRTGLRLTIYERVDRTEEMERGAPSPGNPGSRAGTTSETPVTPLPDATRTGGAPVAPFSYGTRWRIRAKLHPPRNFRNPGAFDYEGYLRDNGISVLDSARAEQVERLPALPAAGLSFGARASTPASWPRFTHCGPRPRPRSWTPWYWAKTHSCAERPEQNSSARAPITCWLFPE